MAEEVSKLIYILDGVQVIAESGRIERSMRGIEKAAKSAGIGAALTFSRMEAAAQGAGIPWPTAAVLAAQGHGVALACSAAGSVAAQAAIAMQHGRAISAGSAPREFQNERMVYHR